MIETDRLLLRQWRDSDLETWVEMNSDPRVMEYYPKTLNRAESLSGAERIREKIEQDGWGLWAVEVKSGAPFIGFVGLSLQDFGQSWCPCIEVGWRLQFDHWGKGYATEAAKAALDFGRERFDVIYSVTAEVNLRSQAVMQRIGLVKRNELTFDHPRVENPTLKRHVVFATT